GSLATFLQGFDQAFASGGKGRRQTEENTGETSDDKSEGEHAEVESDFVKTREIGWAERPCEEDASPGDESSQETTRHCEKKIFDEKLAEQAAAACTESATQSEFLTAKKGAREQKISDVGARYEQYDGNGTEEEQQGMATVADHLMAKCRQAWREIAGGLRI